MSLLGEQNLSPDKYILLLSASEIGIGSILHAFHIPLAGHVLSLNQVFLLSLSAKEATNRNEAAQITSKISIGSAIAKLLSPAGKIFTPMLAILIQGLLFSSSVFVFGRNLIGITVGAVLSSFWGFIQGLILPFIFFGLPLFTSVFNLWDRFTKNLSLPFETLYWILGFGIFIKLGTAITLGFYAWKKGTTILPEYQNKVSSFSNSVLSQNRKKLLLPVWFIASLFITVFSAWINGDSIKENYFILLGRPIALFLTFLVIGKYLRSYVKNVFSLRTNSFLYSSSAGSKS